MLSVILGKIFERLSMKKESVIRQLLMEGPCSMDSIPVNEEQKRLTDVLIELEREINRKFSRDKEALELLKKYNDALNDLCFEESCSCFETGLKFGVLLGMELVK